ncbi:MAG TPA: hypothetical protein VL401_00770 [Alphaproteobacteria bacterium]|jgi:hypothetical protein|nr:hypothetical protein [Alphaproteobacteria bacterium]
MKFIIIAGASLIFLLAFFITIKSLKKLKTEISLSYPFDIFFPKEGQWSVGYFLLVITLLGLLIYLMIKGGFYGLSPA